MDGANGVLGKHVFTTQHHPEMTAEFDSSVVDHLSLDLDTDVIHRAKASQGYGDDNDVLPNGWLTFWKVRLRLYSNYRSKYVC
jgi:hypothetical protein